MRHYWIALGSLAIAACSTMPDDMAGFADVAQGADVVQIEGVGWSRAGDFTIRPLGIEGHFTRSANESGTNGAFSAEGHVRFELSGDGEFGGLSAECAYSRETFREAESIDRNTQVETSVVTGPLIYTCGFFDGERDIGSLELRELPGEGFDVRALRQGRAEVGGAELALRSVHNSTHTRWSTESALGYAMLFRDGEQAMLYSNGAARHIALPREGEDERAAALLTGLALTLVWDPGTD